MKITIENSSRIIEFNGIPGRVWEGFTETGIPVIAFISRIATPAEEDLSQFKQELEEVMPPSHHGLNAFPNRMIM